MKQRIEIEVVSDMVCPWCYIGKRRLEKAIELTSDQYDIDIKYLPFELNPAIPVSGLDHKSYLTEKFGGEERYMALTDRVTAIAASEGLAFHYDKQAIAPNTRKAHALAQLAATEGKQQETVELLFEAYFTNGVDLTDEKNLIQLGANAGIESEKIRSYFADENNLLQIALTEQHLHKLGITGVPFYIVNRKFGISGAQLPDNFIKAFHEAAQEKQTVDSK